MDGQGAPANDPFEAFRKKKKEEAEKAEKLAKITQQASEKQPPREDGRPQGFVTHRHDFGRNPDAEPAPEAKVQPRPKGYKPTQLASEPEGVEPPPKPKGFKTHHLT